MRIWGLLALLLMLPSLSPAQYDYDAPPSHQNEYGVGVTMAMSGFGLGGYYRVALPHYWHLGGELDFYMMRDNKEFEIYDPYFGYYYQINNVNRLFFIPFSVDLKKRLFVNDIEDDFRPYVIGGAGGVVGLNFPRKSQVEGDYPKKNEYEVTANIYLGIGVDIKTRDNFYFSIRPQYRFLFFPNSIAGARDHSGFEIRLEIGKRPVVQE